MKKLLAIPFFLFAFVLCRAANNSYQAAPAVQLTQPQVGGQVFQDVNGNMVATYPNVILTNVFLSSFTVSAFTTLVPAAAGQIVWCSNCTNTLLVISTGTAAGAWAGVVNSTGSQLSVPK